jgi:two-component system CAI-1 autoinducer sensor kinase/phosphatase CqsS
MFQLSERLSLKSGARGIGALNEPKPRPFILTRLIHDLSRRYVEYHAHAQRKIQAAAIIGVIGFPVFYLVWTYVLPQPYESMWLRGIGTGLCLALAVTQWWPYAWRAYTVPFSYFTFLYCLPFFFTLMLLLNDSNAWEMSTLAALIYVVLLYDLVNAIVVLILGSVAALVAYLMMTGGAPIPAGYWMTLPILIFALTGFLGLAYGDNLIAREKLKAAASLASQVAHECRTPLTGIRFEADAYSRQADRLAPARASAHHRGKLGHRSIAYQRGAASPRRPDRRAA